MIRVLYQVGNRRNSPPTLEVGVFLLEKDKSITNYNALGNATFLVAYVNSANFEAFWERYSEHILHYDFPLQIKENFSPLVHPNAATRMA